MTKGGVIAIISSVLVLTACGSEQSRPHTEDLLFLETATGITVAAAGADSAKFQASDAIPSGDWSSIVSTRRSGGGTRLIAVDPITGKWAWDRALADRLRAKAVSGNGKLVALGPVREKHYQQGRATTELVIAGAGSSVPTTLELTGNYEPEAFSTDGETLFVIEYLPSRAPTKYRVRSLDIATGEIDGVYTVDAELQEAMRGTARVQVLSQDVERLYTLYSLRDHGETHTFVHVLSLKEKWAHCVDLPEGFEKSVNSATAMTVSADGSRLYVANAVTGALAAVDTEALSVLKTGETNWGLGKPTHLASSDSHLYLSSGRKLSAVSLETLAETGSWIMEQTITGLQPATKAGHLYVGQRKQIDLMDVVAGTFVDSFDPPGRDSITLLGRTTRMSDPYRKTFTCAC